jgi:hypothetical protein
MYEIILEREFAVSERVRGEESTVPERLSNTAINTGNAFTS